MKKFEEILQLNVNEYTEKKNVGNGVALTYLSWAPAWAEFKKLFPDAVYEVKHWDGKPYLEDPKLGYMVETSITANGQSHVMWLPVLDGTNRALKSEPYTFTNRFGKIITIEAATMFDINTSIMRCLVKNMAMFGLGLYIYQGCDLPPTPFEPMTPEQEARLNELGINWAGALAHLRLSSKEDISAQMANALIIAKEKQKAE